MHEMIGHTTSDCSDPSTWMRREVEGNIDEYERGGNWRVEALCKFERKIFWGLECACLYHWWVIAWRGSNPCVAVFMMFARSGLEMQRRRKQSIGKKKQRKQVQRLQTLEYTSNNTSSSRLRTSSFEVLEEEFLSETELVFCEGVVRSLVG